MCAKLDDKIEILNPPEGSQPGDVITIGTYERNPIPEINPKKSQWDQCNTKVKTDSDGIATFEDSSLWKTDKGYVTSSLLNAVIS